MQPPIPYPGPLEPIKVDAPGVFKTSFWKMFLFIFVWTTFLTCLIDFIFDMFALDHTVRDPMAYAMQVVVTKIRLGLIVAFPATFISCQLYVVKVNAQGISGYSFWGIPNFLQWSEISHARGTNPGGYRGISLSSPTKKNSILLPLFTNDLKGLRDAVSHLAPASNPLREYLENHIK